MPRHYHNETYHHQVRFVNKVRKGAYGIAGIVVAIVIIISADLIIEKWNGDKPSNSTLATNVSYVPQVKIFSSPYFQFQAGELWTEVTPRPESDVYVYRSLRGNFIEQELKIYVNKSYEPNNATYILPVNTTESGELLPSPISEHCKSSLLNQAVLQPRNVVMHKVSFYCAADSTQYVAVVGKISGDTTMQLLRPDGSMATYTIEYRNVTAMPDSGQLHQIIESFQTR
jgi:hypothetical protein